MRSLGQGRRLEIATVVGHAREIPPSSGPFSRIQLTLKHLDDGQDTYLPSELRQVPPAMGSHVEVIAFYPAAGGWSGIPQPHDPSIIQ